MLETLDQRRLHTERLARLDLRTCPGNNHSQCKGEKKYGHESVQGPSLSAEAYKKPYESGNRV